MELIINKYNEIEKVSIKVLSSRNHSRILENQWVDGNQEY